MSAPVTLNRIIKLKQTIMNSKTFYGMGFQFAVPTLLQVVDLPIAPEPDAEGNLHNEDGATLHVTSKPNVYAVAPIGMTVFESVPAVALGIFTMGELRATFTDNENFYVMFTPISANLKSALYESNLG